MTKHIVVLAMLAALANALSREDLLGADEADFLERLGIFTPARDLGIRDARPCNEIGAASSSMLTTSISATTEVSILAVLSASTTSVLQFETTLSTTVSSMSSYSLSSTIVAQPSLARNTTVPIVLIDREYRMYTGDGSVKAGWPSMLDWARFEDLWNDNLPIIQNSCSAYGVSLNSDNEIAQMKSAIQSVADSAGVDSRFILATAMQETSGCVRGAVTYSPGDNIRNPGILQSVDGPGSCNDGTLTNPSSVKTPCQENQIDQMIVDGINGTNSGDGLKQCLHQAGSSAIAQSYYKAARLYNSGQIDESHALEKGVATHCYASDIANRLCGWTTKTSNLCSFDAVGS